VQPRGVRERREQHRAERVDGGPPCGDRAALTGVDADLDGRRGAHGAAPVRADAVEGLLHRAVARQLQHALGRAVRVRRTVFDGEARCGREAVQGVRVGSGGGDQPREIGKRRAGELDLAAGLHGDEGAAGQRIGGG
jgi:hypothetical protein